MAHPRMVDAYVRELLDAAFGTDIEVQGHRYILPLPARPVVEVVGGEGHALRVQVAAPIAIDIVPREDLLEELNGVNRNLPYGRVFLVDHRVWAEHTVLGGMVDRDELQHAVNFVGWVARVHGERLAAAGQGRPAVAEHADDAQDRDGAVPQHAAVNGVANGGALAEQLQLTPAADEPLVDARPAVNAAGYL